MPAEATGGVAVEVDDSNRHHHNDVKVAVTIKFMKVERWMSLIGAMIIVLIVSEILLGLNVQYEGPNRLAIFLFPPLVDQVTSFFEVRMINIAMEKAGNK